MTVGGVLGTAIPTFGMPAMPSIYVRPVRCQQLKRQQGPWPCSARYLGVAAPLQATHLI